MVEQIFLSPLLVASLLEESLLLISWYKRVASRVAKRLKNYDLRQLVNIRKSSKIYRIIV